MSARYMDVLPRTLDHCATTTAPWFRLVKVGKRLVVRQPAHKPTDGGVADQERLMGLVGDVRFWRFGEEKAGEETDEING
jgi:hypothetical protein